MHYDDEGVHRNLDGPFRAGRQQAEKYLAAMRAAGVAAARLLYQSKIDAGLGQVYVNSQYGQV